MLLTLIFGFYISKKTLLDCILVSNSLLKHNANVPFLKQIGQVMKWVPFNNVEQKRLWGKLNKPPPTH